MGLQRYGDHHSDRQLLVVRVLHIAESGLTSIRDIKLIPQCMSRTGADDFVRCRPTACVLSREGVRKKLCNSDQAHFTPTPCSRTRTTVTLDLPSKERWG